MQHSRQTLHMQHAHCKLHTQHGYNIAQFITSTAHKLLTQHSRHTLHSTNSTSLAQRVFTLTPSSAAAERAFSMLKHLFDLRQFQGGTLSDYVQAAVMARFRTGNLENDFHLCCGIIRAMEQNPKYHAWYAEESKLSYFRKELLSVRFSADCDPILCIAQRTHMLQTELRTATIESRAEATGDDAVITSDRNRTLSGIFSNVSIVACFITENFTLAF